MSLKFLPLILLIVPILEIAVFVLVGGEIGVLATLAMILFTAILGSILLRIEGFRTLNKITTQMNAGRLPGEELGNGAMILVAGVLLLTPGFVTDGLGFCLFVPGVRKIIWQFLASRISVQAASGFGAGGFSSTHSTGNEEKRDGVVDLDPEDFHEEPKPDSPWFDRINVGKTRD